jgi:hypothetical protein
MGIHACSRKGFVEADALGRADCARHGIQLMVVALTLYLLSGIASAHMALLYTLSAVASAHMTELYMLAGVASAHMTQFFILSGDILAHMAQPSPVIIVQILQALAAISAIASTVQTFLSAKSAFPTLAKPNFAKPALADFEKPVFAELAKPGTAKLAKSGTAKLAKSGIAEFAKPVLRSFAKPAFLTFAKPAPTDFAQLYAGVGQIPAVVAQNVDANHSLASGRVKNPWSVSISGSKNVLVIPMGGLRNVLIIFACGILLGSLSPRIGETVMILASLRGAVVTIYNRMVGVSATGCNTKKMDETESSENYILRDICN